MEEKQHGYFGDDFLANLHWDGSEWVKTENVDLEDLEKQDGELLLYHNNEQPYMELTFTPVNTFSIYNDDGTIVEFDTDTGEVTFGENFSMSETARVFWECLGKSKDHPDPDALWDEYCKMGDAHANFDQAMKVID